MIVLHIFHDRGHQPVTPPPPRDHLFIVISRSARRPRSGSRRFISSLGVRVSPASSRSIHGFAPNSHRVRLGRFVAAPTARTRPWTTAARKIVSKGKGTL